MTSPSREDALRQSIARQEALIEQRDKTVTGRRPSSRNCEPRWNPSSVGLSVNVREQIRDDVAAFAGTCKSAGIPVARVAPTAQPVAGKPRTSKGASAKPVFIASRRKWSTYKTRCGHPRDAILMDRMSGFFTLLCRRLFTCISLKWKEKSHHPPGADGNSCERLHSSRLAD